MLRTQKGLSYLIHMLCPHYLGVGTLEKSEVCFQQSFTKRGNQEHIGFPFHSVPGTAWLGKDHLQGTTQEMTDGKNYGSRAFRVTTPAFSCLFIVVQFIPVSKDKTTVWSYMSALYRLLIPTGSFVKSDAV